MSFIKKLLISAVVIFIAGCSLSYGRDKKSFVSEENKSGEKTTLSSKEQFKFDYFFMEALRKKEAGDLASASDNLYRCHLLQPKSAVVFLELASISSMVRQYGSALAYSRRAVSLNPANVRYQRALAEMSVRTENYKEAINLYEKLLKSDKKNAKSYYPQLASVYAAVKENGKACEALDKYAELTELTPAISEEKFKLYIGMGETKKAFRQLDELIASYPDDYNYVLYKAEMYCVLRDTLSADKTFEKAFRKDGDDPSLQYIFARYLDGAKRDTVQALDYYYKTILNPKSTFNLQSSALLSASLDSTQALNDTVYDKFIAQYPDEYLSYFCKAIYLYAKNDTSCYNYFKKSLSINPSQESTWMTILTYYSESQNLDSTISVCQAALEHFPSNVDFNYMLGYAKYAKKEYPAAVNSLRKAAKLAQKNKNILLSSRLYGSLGDCYHEMGEKENAFAAYDTAVVLDESNMMALNNYAYYLSVENRDLKKAERLSGITVNKDPKNATFLDTYAWVYFKLGEYGMANLYIEQAYNYGGKENAEVVEHYGDILYKMGEPQEAYLTKWKEALKLKEANGAVDESNNLRKKVETGVYVE